MRDVIKTGIIILLLFVDMAVFGKTQDELQHNPDLLYTYCCNEVLK